MRVGYGICAVAITITLLASAIAASSEQEAQSEGAIPDSPPITQSPLQRAGA